MPENVSNFAIVYDIDKYAKVSRIKSIKIEYIKQIRFYTNEDGELPRRVETAKPILEYRVEMDDKEERKYLLGLFHYDSENSGTISTAKCYIALGKNWAVSASVTAPPSYLSGDSELLYNNKPPDIIIKINGDDMAGEGMENINDLMNKMRNRIAKNNEKRRSKSASSFENRFEIMDLDEE